MVNRARAAVHLSVAERRRAGRTARKEVPRSAHAAWSAPAGRRDPVELIEEQNADRLQWLVPVRRGRMRVSPFTFYRGAARIMASDLASTPVSGFSVQACGDAHLSNFGVYASPERHLVLDANDFDETLPGPWEWDLKRLATSFMIAAQHRNFDDVTWRRLAARSVAGYRLAMTEFADRRALDLWYDHLPLEALREIDEFQSARARKELERAATKARSRDQLQAHDKFTVEIDGRFRIRSDPPLLVPLAELPDEDDPALLETIAYDALDTYVSTLSDDRRCLLDRFVPVDIAVKVVGVGSVGTQCFVVLLEGRDRQDPLLLQVKEATHSVLEEHLPPSQYDNHGRRVVEGQRLMQAASDIFLGWTSSVRGRDYYVRQLRDWKGAVDPEIATAEQLDRYARVCGWTLACPCKVWGPGGNRRVPRIGYRL